MSNGLCRGRGRGGTAFVRETFAAFDIQEVPTTWQISASTACLRVNELIITNRAGDAGISPTNSG